MSDVLKKIYLHLQLRQRVINNYIILKNNNNNTVSVENKKKTKINLLLIIARDFKCQCLIYYPERDIGGYVIYF